MFFLKGRDADRDEKHILGTDIPARTLGELKALSAGERAEIRAKLEEKLEEATAKFSADTAGLDSSRQVAVLVAERRRLDMADAVAEHRMSEEQARYAF